jgi:alkyl hydroperoxide reductase subunit AhpC
MLNFQNILGNEFYYVSIQGISHLFELPNFRQLPKNMENLKKLGVEFLSMSIDSIFVHKMWNDYELSKMVKGGIPLPMLSDAGGKVGTLYGVYDEDAGVETRGRFIIDPDGVIQGYEILTPPV